MSASNKTASHSITEKSRSYKSKSHTGSKSQSQNNKSKSHSGSKSQKSLSFSKIKANCSAEKLLAFSKKHYTYINQIFGDATVRQIIEEEYPTTWQFKVAKAGPEFGNSFHHTVRDREQPEMIVCSGIDGVQDLHKNVNDTLCQSYSLMNYFEIPIQLSEEKGKLKQIYHETNQKAMIQMYRDLLNSNIENYEGIDFKEILTNEILSDKRNKKLWRDFSTSRGHVNMNPEIFFQNIEDTLDEWEEYGYWFFIGKGECPTHSTYSAEMNYLKDRSTDVSNEMHEGFDMGVEDVNRGKSRSKTRSNSKSNSSTRKNKSKSSSNSKK
uniref:Uncharacterized protein n=1 Tax=viral metagenome TaxID=1070528 RepID=A0A6C0I7W7_9ZZZZ